MDNKTFKVITLGCKVNSCESAVIEKNMLEHGFKEADSPDIYIINSCAVTGASVDKARRLVESLKKKFPECVVVLCGCYPQSFPNAANECSADIITGNSAKDKIPEMIENYFENKKRAVKIDELPKAYDESSAVPDENRTRAFIKIEDGCDRYCSYCIIPTARGRVRSLSVEKICEQALQCVNDGHKELVLTGINLGCYGQEYGLTLADAVEAAARSGVQRLRLSSLEPEMLSDGIIERLGAVKTLCPHFHLSLQSGSDSVLKKMNRRYTSEEYAHIAGKFREVFPDCSITTDIIVGFPAESEDDFLRSVEFANEMRFAKVHVFPFSARSGTVAAKMEQLDRSVISERAKRLLVEAEKLERAFFERQVGTLQTVLIEKPKSSDYSQGFTEKYVPVRIMCGNISRHTLVRVRIVKAEDTFCIGEADSLQTM